MSAATTSPRKPAEHRCPVCGRVFPDAQLLDAHKRVDHGHHSSPPAGVS